jgi:hypothetical protein
VILRAVLLCACALACAAQTLVFKHVTVIDATGAPARKNLSVAIDGDRITAIGKRVKTPRGARVIEAKGKFLIPGLWDMHMHLPPGSPPFDELLAYGITGVREMFTGVPVELIRAWRLRPDLPRIMASGFVDGLEMLSAGQPPPGAFAVERPADARAAVRYLKQMGFDAIKVYNSLSRDAYFAIADQSRMLGIPFAGHVPEAVSVGEASDAGQRSQEHLINVMLACSTQEEKLREERIATMTTPQLTGEARLRVLAFPKTEGLFDTYSEEKAAALFAKFVRNDTWHTPTLVLLDAFVKRQDLTRQQFYMRDLDDAGFAAEMVHIRALLVRYQKLVGDMHRAGVKFLAGTDSSAFTAVLPGAGLHDELALLVESGFTPLEALQTATRNPAIYFGKLAEWGTIEAGKAADLVLLDADPLEDIHNTRKIRGVVLKGKYFEPQMRDAR